MCGPVAGDLHWIRMREWFGVVAYGGAARSKATATLACQRTIDQQSRSEHRNDNSRTAGRAKAAIGAVGVAAKARRDR